jgi:hypothetical protein
MALTMTRTRTQTTLTRLAKLVANLHGEIEAIERLAQEKPEHEQVLAARRLKLEADRDAVYLTLKQFDPELDGVRIRALDDWMKPYGSRGSKIAMRRYLAALLGLNRPGIRGGRLV